MWPILIHENVPSARKNIRQNHRALGDARMTTKIQRRMAGG
ncbi:MAG: hypothetical protein Q8K00_06135 [Syntrophales bacterium]|nr:hypothetical protein [Syntrophales bacterium]